MWYRRVAELNEKNFDVHVCSFIYTMGVEAEKVHSAFTVQQDSASEADNTTFDQLIQMFDAHFTPKVNLIHEQAVSRARSQQSGQNIETDVRCLNELAEHTAFEDKDIAIRDRLVVGLRDSEV